MAPTWPQHGPFGGILGGSNHHQTRSWALSCQPSAPIAPPIPPQGPIFLHLVSILDGIPVDFESFLSKIFMVLRSSVNWFTTRAKHIGPICSSKFDILWQAISPATFAYFICLKKLTFCASIPALTFVIARPYIHFALADNGNSVMHFNSLTVCFFGEHAWTFLLSSIHHTSFFLYVRCVSFATGKNRYEM